SGEFFGLMDICGKGASFVGTTLVGIVSQMTNSVNLGVGVLTLMFIIGLFLFTKVNRMID
ncbi:MAG: MFS transporter, partial [Erysipelotrichaceae bacterium]|nr:MFS transporter [Erysipelotrichaceae bacterium]